MLAAGGEIPTGLFDFAFLGTVAVLVVAAVVGSRRKIRKGASETISDGLRELTELFTLKFTEDDD